MNGNTQNNYGPWTNVRKLLISILLNVENSYLGAKLYLLFQVEKNVKTSQTLDQHVVAKV